MKTKNTILCSILALTLCSSVNAFSVSALMQNDALKQDKETLTSILQSKVKVSPIDSESQISPAMQLIEAIKNHDVATASDFLDYADEFDVDEQDELGFTPLIWAIKTDGMESIANRLIYLSDLSKVDIKNRNALMWAIDKKKKSISNDIIQYMEDFYSAEAFNVQDKDGATALAHAVNAMEIDTITRLLKVRDEMNNHVVIINPTELKEHPRFGESPVINSTCVGADGKMLKKFIDAKYDNGDYRADLNYADDLGYTALSRASHCSLTEVSMLLSAKDKNGKYRVTNMNSSRFEENPLIMAIIGGRMDIVQTLVQAKDTNGKYRVDLNVELNSSFTYGLADGTDIFIKEGDTPLNIAMKAKRKEIATYLLNVKMARG